MVLHLHEPEMPAHARSKPKHYAPRKVAVSLDALVNLFRPATVKIAAAACKDGLLTI